MIEFGIKDFLDILLVASLLVYVYRLMKESRSLNIFVGIMLFVLIWLFVSQILEMRLLGSILDKLVSVGVIALIVISRKTSEDFFMRLVHRKVCAGLYASSTPARRVRRRQTRRRSCLSCLPA